MTVVVVMGVAGSGKTTVGTALAARLGVEYAEADDFHPQANIAKMTAGIPLTDEDREPWLRAIAQWIAAHRDAGGVVSASALKRRYREILRTGGDLWFLHLDGTRDMIADRIAGRTHRFMPASLMDSQFDTLEPLGADEAGMVAAVTESPRRIAAAAVAAFHEAEDGHAGLA